MLAGIIIWRIHATGGLSLSVAAGALVLSTLVHGAAPGAATVADAAMAKDNEAVLSLLKQGGDVNAAQGDGMTALHWAAMHGDAALAEHAALRRRQRAGDDAARRLHAAAPRQPDRHAPP